MQTKKRRAEPLPPEDRRLAIVKAILPLLVARGAAATTKEMAEAAGIAEGTIFGVFDDKTALIHEAVKVSMDPAPILSALSQIEPAHPLEVQLGEAARILLDHFERITVLIGILRTMPMRESGPPAGVRRYVAESATAVLAAITDLFARHTDRLRVEPARAATAFQGLIFARLQPLLPPEDKLTIEEIVTILLSGVATPFDEAVV